MVITWIIQYHAVVYKTNVVITCIVDAQSITIQTLLPLVIQQLLNVTLYTVGEVITWIIQKSHGVRLTSVYL